MQSARLELAVGRNRANCSDPSISTPGSSEWIWALYSRSPRFFILVPAFGNDLLLVTMTAREHARLPYFAVMATAGSLLGCFITDVISRKGGEAGLERKFSRRRLEYVRKKITKNAGSALGVAALMPPPFPFTPFVAAAAVLQYPRKKLLLIVGLGRFGRFFAEGLLAVLIGKKILRWAQSPAMYYTVLGILVLSLVGTGFSLYSWFKYSTAARLAKNRTAR